MKFAEKFHFRILGRRVTSETCRKIPLPDFGCSGDFPADTEKGPSSKCYKMCGVYVCEGMIVSAFHLANYTFHLKGDLETVLPNVRRINTVGCHPTGWDV